MLLRLIWNQLIYIQDSENIFLCVVWGIHTDLFQYKYLSVCSMGDTHGYIYIYIYTDLYQRKIKYQIVRTLAEQLCTDTMHDISTRHFWAGKTTTIRRIVIQEIYRFK